MSIKRKVALEVLSATVLLCCILLAALFYEAGRADATTVEAEISGGELEEYYYVGSELELPSTVQITYEGENYTGRYSETIGPDSKIYTSNLLQLSDAGSYEAMYSFSADGKNLKTGLTFLAVEANWQMVSEQSSVEYGAVTTNESSENGLIVTIADGDSFTYNVPVDLKSSDITDIITFYPEQTAKKFEQRENKLSSANFDAEYISVTLTDCYDPTVYVTAMIYYAPTWTNSIYARTAASGQGEFGLYLDCPIATQPSVYLDGLRYGLYEGVFGQSITSTGTVPSYYKWSFDFSKNRVYLSESNGKSYLINDLDDPAVSSNQFPGFTTGEVYVSVSASDFYTASTIVQIEAIGELRGEELMAGGYIDHKSPVIEIGQDNADSGIYIEKDKEFTLPDAAVYDANPAGGVKTSVYYNYGTAMQSSVAVKDNKFIPTLTGTYTVEYRATDAFGNIGRAYMPLYCLEESVMTLEVTENHTLKAGVQSEALSYEAFSYNGSVDVEITAVHEGGTEYAIGSDLTFIPLSAGNYTIVYTYTDGVETKSYSYTTECQPNSEYSFIGEPATLNYYIKNAEYDVAAFSAYSFAGSEPEPVQTTVEVSFDDGEYAAVGGSTFTVSGNSSLRFRYTAGSAVFETEEIRIVDVGYGDELRIEDYFIGDFTTVKDYDWIEFTSAVQSGNNSLEFINRLSYALFSMDFQIPANASHFNSVSLVFSDFADLTNRVVVKYESLNGGLSVSVDGANVTTLNGQLNDGNVRYIRYTAASNAFYFSDNTETISVPFKFDFDSGYCLFSIEFEGISGNAGITLFRLQNQLISDRTYDDFEPQIYCRESPGYTEIGSQAVAYGAYASDVLSPCLMQDLKLSVTAPDGSYVTSADGVILNGVPGDMDYIFSLDSYGRYMVEYTVRDESGNSAIQYYFINVADLVEPTVTFDDGATAETVQNVRVNYRYKVKDYTAADNYSAAENLVTIIYIYNSKGVLVSFDSEEFTLTEAGAYTVYVYCFDEAGNYALASYQLNATEEGA